ncbi:FecR family protein [Gaoshiqia sp. Z1-71]|uniref:FecR family protein n=1 Tax=Gaoshiqia hydrogeniformans TaxID=3290090 RepID=UPI003BF8CEF0
MPELEKYIEDKRFVKWVFEPDPETEKYYAAYFDAHPDEREELLRAKKELGLLAVRNKKPQAGKKEIIYQRMMDAGMRKKPSRSTGFSFAGFARYAAVALLFFSIGSLLMYEISRNRIVMPVDESLLVKSASLNAMVYLADGSQREIGNSEAIIDFSVPGQLVIQTDTIKIGTVRHENSKNLVVVPFGKRARVKLYDNSELKLNAGSRIILPREFGRETRNAYLIGEAFFDITKDPGHPFLVETSSAVIKVLGTNFHLSAYPDRQELTAFLQEGQIRFRASDHSLFAGWVDLKPTEQLSLNKTTKNVKVQQGNGLYYQLWKDGIVQFDNEPVSDLLNRVEQYFNITIRVPDEQVGSRRIKGKLDLNKELNEVFEYIELITDKKIMKENAGAFSLN